jgi:nicotinate phosphoribosyltransferase
MCVLPTSLTLSLQVYLALKYDLAPSGTIAHEWIMAIGATGGYKDANSRAMDMWEEVYPAAGAAGTTPGSTLPLIMLTDTYTAEIFFSEFCADPQRAARWAALRQDSGDPFTFVRQAKAAWVDVAARLGASPETALEGKRVVFSDSLDVERSIALQRGCDEIGLSAAFGIGTFFTNDFKKASDKTAVSKPLNMVIKLSQINGRDCVKLSDDRGKHTGTTAEVERAQRELGLV